LNSLQPKKIKAVTPKTHRITPLLEILFLYNEVATASEPEDQKSGE
jgi:hypothetical protein